MSVVGKIQGEKGETGGAPVFTSTSLEAGSLKKKGKNNDPGYELRTKTVRARECAKHNSKSQ